MPSWCWWLPKRYGGIAYGWVQDARALGWMWRLAAGVGERGV
jgi:hypothetical protein